MRLPFPLITAPTIILSLRLNTKAALSMMLVLAEIDPLVVPLPIIKVPALIVVAPV